MHSKYKNEEFSKSSEKYEIMKNKACTSIFFWQINVSFKNTFKIYFRGSEADIYIDIPATMSCPKCLQWLNWAGHGWILEQGTQFRSSTRWAGTLCLEPSPLPPRASISRHLELGAEVVTEHKCFSIRDGILIGQIPASKKFSFHFSLHKLYELLMDMFMFIQLYLNI